ncbi:uncharacterized protein LOC135243899 isoform X3 [Anguilla rostrata]|uniref:uncharacterized protein LOC135243899 isoform X3 n=1 Tax=Anguilla rostrata TaxID=7938 RepID=UPI0030CBC9FB
MTEPPTPLPGATLNGAIKRNLEISGRGPPIDSDTERENETKISHMERSASLHMRETLRPVPLPRSKTHIEPVSKEPGRFQRCQDQQKATQGVKMLEEDEEKEPCSPSLPSQSLPQPPSPHSSASALPLPPPPPPPSPPPLPPPNSVSEDGQIPLYLEILPEETRPPEVSHLERSTSLLTRRPEPPTPVHRSKSHSELLFRKLALLQISQDQQKADQGAKKPLDTCHRSSRPERPPPPNFSKSRGGHKALLPVQMSTWGPSNSCDTQYKDSKTPPAGFDTEYEDSKTPPAGFDTECEDRIDPPGSSDTQYDDKTYPVVCDTQYKDSKTPPVASDTQYGYSETSLGSCDTLYTDIITPPGASDTGYEDRKTPPGASDTGYEDRKTPPFASDAQYKDIETSPGACDTQYKGSLKAIRSKAVHDFFSKRPLPPIPQSKSQSEPLYEELGWCSCVKNEDSEERKPEDIEVLMAWWRTIEEWDNMPLDYELKEEEEIRVFTLTAYRIKMGLRLFNCLLSKNSESLQNRITELYTTADNLDKARKRAKIATMTGGTTGTVGGVAVVAGLVLAPLTLGASLVVSAVGVGVATAGGLTGASAALTNKVNSNLDRKRVEKIVLDYWDEVSDIERCLHFVCLGMGWLGQQDASRLRVADEETVAVARLAEVARGNSSSIQTACQSLEILQKFSLDMDDFFTNGESQKVKKGTETKFADKIRSLAQQLQDGLDSLMTIRENLTLAASTIGVYEEPRYC